MSPRTLGFVTGMVIWLAVAAVMANFFDWPMTCEDPAEDPAITDSTYELLITSNDIDGESAP